MHARSVHQEPTDQKTRRSRAFLPHTLPRSPPIFLTAPLSDNAVTLHLGPCEKLRRYRKLATSSIKLTIGLLLFSDSSPTRPLKAGRSFRRTAITFHGSFLDAIADCLLISQVCYNAHDPI